MAIAIPFLLASAGATAMTTAIVSVAFAVTGISEKINKAASNVFGEDLVKIANIAGMAYGAFSEGGFDLSGAASKGEGLTQLGEAGGYAADVASGADELVQLGDAATAGYEAVADTASPGFNLKDMAEPPTGSAVQAEVAGAAPPESMATIVEKAAPPPATTGATTQVASTPSMEVPKLADSNFNLSQAQPQALNAVKLPSGQTLGSGTPVSESFLDKLVRMSTDSKTGEIKNSVITLGGDALKGLAGGYSAAKQREQYDAELKRRDSLANMGGAGWRQAQ